MKEIEVEETELAAPIVFPSKENGLPSYFVHYQKLNEVTKRRSFSIPKMDECIGSLGNVLIFPNVDGNRIYLE